MNDKAACGTQLSAAGTCVRPDGMTSGAATWSLFLIGERRGELMRIGFCLGLLIAALAASGSSVAQDADFAPDEGAGVNADPDTVISAIEQARDKGAEIGEMEAINHIEFVEVDTLKGDKTSRAIENAVSLNEYDVRNLQSTLAEQPEISAKLEAEGVAVRNIFAATVDSDRLVIFVRKD